MRPRTRIEIAPPALLAALAIGFLVVLPAHSQTIEVGSTSLPLVSQATRSEMLGLVDLYRVGLYLPRGASIRAAASNPRVPKALSVQVLYDGSLPDGIPREWKRELMPPLEARQQEQLRQAYANLTSDDELRITYSPAQGTTVVLNGRQVLHDQGYRLMAGFLDLWIGQTPVSEEVKDQLLAAR